jgi:hypothetical protein
MIGIKSPRLGAVQHTVPLFPTLDQNEQPTRPGLEYLPGISFLL